MRSPSSFRYTYIDDEEQIEKCEIYSFILKNMCFRNTSKKQILLPSHYRNRYYVQVVYVYSTILSNYVQVVYVYSTILSNSHVHLELVTGVGHLQFVLKKT